MNGKESSPDYLNNHFESAMIEYGRKNFTSHNIRHFCASYLVCLGWTAKEISEKIGHAGFETTDIVS